MKVFYQGEIVEESEVSIGIRSKAFNYGLACFEGIRAYWDDEEEQLFGFCMEEHYDRLLESCKCLNMEIPFTSRELCTWTIELLKANNCRETTYIRPVVYKGGEHVSPTLLDDDDRIVIYTQPMGDFAGKEEFRAMVSTWRRISDTAMPPRTKATAGYMNSALANLEAKENGYDEAIFLTDKGFVCEGPGENIFLVKKGKLITPPPSDDILEGITRDIVMILGRDELGMEVVERSVARTELYNSEEVFFSGTAMEVTPVVEVDNRQVGTGKKGEVFKKIKAIFEDITVGKMEKYRGFVEEVW